MKTTQLKLYSPEISIRDATKQFNCTEDDLIYLAAEGKLTFYVKAEFWSVKSIFSINLSPEFYEAETLLDIFGGNLENVKQKLIVKLSHDFVDDYILKYGDIPDNDTIDYGDNQYGKFVVMFGKKGKFSELYKIPLVCFQPIAACIIAGFRDGSTFLHICLDLNKAFPQLADSYNVLIETEPSFLFQDILNEGKLFVKVDELTKLASADTTNRDRQPPIIKGPRAVSVERYSDWQRRADEKLAKKPGQSKTALAKAIYRDLMNEKSKYTASESSIRQNIKV